MTIAVIGRGLWGAAAARHLAKAGHKVVLIGPDEPSHKESHSGVFASHYDEGRITRKNALDPYWVEVSIASIDRYDEIEAESGISFYAETGAVMAGGAAFMARVDVGRLEHNVPCDVLDHAGLSERFPFFRFPEPFTGYHEPTRAGHISPRRLVAAQTKAAQRFGADVQAESVLGLEDIGNEVRVQTESGTQKFQHVLVASGYNTDHLLGRAKSLDVYARTVAFFELDDAETARLAKMPALVWDTQDDPYLLPPIRYPDGKTYIKLGGDPQDVPLETPQIIHDWFRSGGNPEVRDHLHGEIMKLMPDLNVKGVSMASCVTSWTHDRMPQIARLSERVAVTAGGNGAGAKCSDEIGRLGAQLISEKLGEGA